MASKYFGGYKDAGIFSFTNTIEHVAMIFGLVFVVPV